jgi:D-serine deaminase-like pyridoxal phosphate-dependent protein
MPSLDAVIPHAKLEDYQIEADDRLLTPALAIYADKVDANIAATVSLLGGRRDGWRPHVKTAKLGWVMRRYAALGIAHVKCATTLELQTACGADAKDVLVAYPVVGARVSRVREIAARHPQVAVSVLVERAEACAAWEGSGVGVFLDINPGMDRTGIEADRDADIVALARAAVDRGLELRGLHYYDGHIAGIDRDGAEAQAHRGYDRLVALAATMDRAGLPVREVITAGTPAFVWTRSYRGFDHAPFVHRASPGTLVYNDTTSLSQLPPSFGYQPAALVVSTVVSHPTPRRITCDAGHKTVSADAGVPTCAVLGHPELSPQKPSEEHLPFEVRPGTARPGVGDRLYLLPRHVCPTVNNFDVALIVRDGGVESIEPVTARGREAPIG